MKLAKYVMAASVLTMLAAGSCAQAADGSDFSVALIIGTGGLGDGGFNDSLLAGVQAAEKELGITYQLVEPSEVSEFEADYMDLSAAGKYDLIIGGGFDQTEALASVASEFPDQKYLFVDGELDGYDNVTSILFKDQEKTYLVGTVAGMNRSEEHTSELQSRI